MEILKTEQLNKLKKKRKFNKLKHIIREDKNLYDGLNYGINIYREYIIILHSEMSLLLATHYPL